MIPLIAQWHDGPPEEIQVGMILHLRTGKMFLVGDRSTVPRLEFIQRWTWGIKPWEVTWLADVTNRKFY